MKKEINPQSLWSREILFLFSATFVAYSSISLFFFYHEYLRTLSIDQKWFGLLISIFSGVSLVVRPVVSPFFHRGNAYRYLFLGAILLSVSLCSYGLASGFWGMLTVRALHGLAFVVLGAALMTITIDYVPRERSAHFFGFLSIIVLIPNTLIPPFLPLLSREFGGFTGVLTLFGAISLLVIPLTVLARSQGPTAQEKTSSKRPTGQEFFNNIKDWAIIIVLLAMLLLYSAYSMVFFFLDGYGRSMGISNTGLFLTLATIGEMGIRVIGGNYFDRSEKIYLLAFTMMGLCAGYLLLGSIRSQAGFFPLGLALGLGWGIAMPVFNGLMFDISNPNLKAFNSNLGLQMFQGGLFLGPFVGAPIITHWGYGTLFFACGVSSLACSVFLLALRGTIKKRPFGGLRGKGDY